MQALLFDVAERAHPVAQAFEWWPRLIGENADATDLRAPLRARPAAKPLRRREVL
jgi:hypothetical protein